MRSSVQRLGKYGKKLRAAIIPGQAKRYNDALGGRLQMERFVKRLAIPPMQQFSYIAFGERLLRILSRHKGAIAEAEACVEWTKWLNRGLDRQFLNPILCNYVPSLCDPDWGPYGLPWTGQLTSYRAGDDGSYQKGYTLSRPIVKGAGSARFTDNGNGTVTDNATNLMWMKDPFGTGAPLNAKHTWNNAIDVCEALAYAGHSDWRLPNIKELVSVLDYAFANPSADPAFITMRPAEAYFSSTTRPGAATEAYVLQTLTTAISRDLKTWTRFVYPTRAGRP